MGAIVLVRGADGAGGVLVVGVVVVEVVLLVCYLRTFSTASPLSLKSPSHPPPTPDIMLDTTTLN